MTAHFADIAFTPAVKALQERSGSRAAYARLEGRDAGADRLGPKETAFLTARDSFYLASVGATGWPYVQHRGGPPGFLKVVDERRIGFADLGGNRQYVSAGNLAGDDRVALIAVDYPARRRLKLLGHARAIEAAAAPDLAAALAVDGYPAEVERLILIEVEAFDWNCPQHITPRFTVAEVERAVAPLRARIAALEAELATRA